MKFSPNENYEILSNAPLIGKNYQCLLCVSHNDTNKHSQHGQG